MGNFLKAIGLVVALGAVAATAVAAQASTAVDRILAAGKISIAVQNDVPPYSRIGADNEVEGLDISIARQIAADLGVKLDLVVVTGANRIPTLLSGRADLAIATLSISPQRAATIDISIPYTAYPMVVIGPESRQLTGYAETEGLVVGVTRGTMQDEVVTRNAPKARIQRYDDDATTIQALVTNQVDATVFGTAVLADLAARYPDRGFEAKFDAYLSYAGIGVRRTEPDLLQWVNTWVFFNRTNGFLDELHRTFLGQETPDLPSY